MNFLSSPKEITMKLFLFFASRHLMVYGDWRYNFTHSLTRHWMEVSSSIHGPTTLAPGKESVPSTYRTGGWEVPSSSMGALEETGELNPVFPVIHLVSCYTAWATPMWVGSVAPAPPVKQHLNATRTHRALSPSKQVMKKLTSPSTQLS